MAKSNDWQANDCGDKCPRCKGILEVFTLTINGQDYQGAERCPNCRWQMTFMAGVPLSRGYKGIGRMD